jgi:hypothetical protein
VPEPAWPTLLDLWPSRIDGPALLTTFTFDAAFFELRLLPELVRRGAHPVLVLVDRDEGFAHAVDVLAHLDGAGRDYLLLPIALPGKRCFHPKVHFFPSQGIALVGSGNLTPGGAGRNLEAVDILHRSDAPAALEAVASFFRRLLADETVGLDDADRAAQLALLPPARALPDDPDVRFLHTLDGPLLPRLRTILGKSDFNEALLTAAFHDQDHATSRAVLDALGGPAGSVAADAAAPWPGAPAVLAGRLVEPIEGGKVRSRPLHAKVIIAEGAEGAITVTGSANLTAAAWWAHNVETLVVRLGVPGSFDAFRSAVRVEPRAWEPPRPPPPPANLPPPVPIRWARVDGGMVTVGMTHVEGATFRLVSGPSRVDLELAADVEGYRGPGEAMIGRALLLQVDAPGHRRGTVVVQQPAFLSTTGRVGRLKRVLQRIEAGLADATDRRELFACLADVLSAVQRSAPLPARSAADRAPGKGTSSFHGDTDEAILAAATDLPPDVAPTGPDLDRATIRIARLVDLLVGTGTSDAERTEDADERERNQGGTARREGPRAVRDTDEWTYEQSLKLSAHNLGRIGETAEADPARASLVHLTFLRLLGELCRKFPKRAAALGVHRLQWMAAAWAAPEWPDVSAGWALAAQIEPERGALTVVAEAFSALPRDGADAHRDVAHRIVAGLSASGVAPNDALTASLLGHVSADERARALVQPLWELEEAWLRHSTDPGRFERARLVASTIPPPGGGRGSLYAVWRAVRPRAGRRVRGVRADGACPACRSLLSAHARGRLRGHAHVEACSCTILLAHGEPEKLHAP